MEANTLDIFLDDFGQLLGMLEGALIEHGQTRVNNKQDPWLAVEYTSFLHHIVNCETLFRVHLERGRINISAPRCGS